MPRQHKIVQHGAGSMTAPYHVIHQVISQISWLNRKNITMKYRILNIFLTVVVLIILLVYADISDAATDAKSYCGNTLASPINNFCEVKPGVLWRGSRPNKAAAAWLIENGVKTVLNLELLHDDMDEFLDASVRADAEYQVDYFRVKTWEPLYAVATASADDDVIKFIAIASYAIQPLYVHCRAGENRTGVMIAAYKIIIEGQTSDAQLDAILTEMQSYEGFWSDSTTRYIRSLVSRRDEFLRKAKALKLEHPEKVICQKGNCAGARSAI
jgi:hypothetical protein